eukprot:scaffold986_cov237-Pinguiococcus_pyrenoidosus.AAC.23
MSCGAGKLGEGFPVSVGFVWAFTAAATAPACSPLKRPIQRGIACLAAATVTCFPATLLMASHRISTSWRCHRRLR